MEAGWSFRALWGCGVGVGGGGGGGGITGVGVGAGICGVGSHCVSVVVISDCLLRHTYTHVVDLPSTGSTMQHMQSTSM